MKWTWNCGRRSIDNKSIVSTDIAKNHATALAHIDHPNVARILGIHDAIQPGGNETQPALVMDYLEGLDLSDWLSQDNLDALKIIKRNYPNFLDIKICNFNNFNNFTFYN